MHKITSPTCNPEYAAGLADSTTETITGLEPRMRKPYSAESLHTTTCLTFSAQIGGKINFSKGKQYLFGKFY